jgi:hypothetical protein
LILVPVPPYTLPSKRPTARFCNPCILLPGKRKAEQIVQDAEGQIRQLLIQNPNVQKAFLQILNSLKKQPA